jgi:hypothetical protein
MLHYIVRDYTTRDVVLMLRLDSEIGITGPPGIIGTYMSPPWRYEKDRVRNIINQSKNIDIYICIVERISQTQWESWREMNLFPSVTVNDTGMI